jgi:glycosyltransferase involved in cell wall biosynthesis
MSPNEPMAPAPSLRAGTASSVLVVGYAFPPIHVQMSPVMARLVAGLHEQGFAVDVICADPAVWPLPRDAKLLEYVTGHCRRVQRLRPSRSVLRYLVYRLRRLRDLPDCMAQLHDSAVAAVLAADPMSYAGVITVSPCHSVNPVMVQVKRRFPNLRWIAHFCDPWANNPLEPRWDIRLWNRWYEPQTLRAATYVTHSSPQALEQVLEAYPFLSPERTRLVPHVFDPGLYPPRPKRRNDRVTIRFLGTLFDRRTPQPVFLALGQLLKRRPELRDRMCLELIGKVEPASLLEGRAAAALPTGMVRHRPPLSYVESLELMYDADLLLVIEADIAATPFVPSKVTDYMGANTPIVGIVPAGGCREILDRLGCPTVGPDDPAGIAVTLETAIDRVIHFRGAAWCDEEVRGSFDLASGAAVFAALLRSNLA